MSISVSLSNHNQSSGTYSNYAHKHVYGLWASKVLRGHPLSPCEVSVATFPPAVHFCGQVVVDTLVPRSLTLLLFGKATKVNAYPNVPNLRTGTRMQNNINTLGQKLYFCSIRLRLRPMYRQVK